MMSALANEASKLNRTRADVENETIATLQDDTHTQNSGEHTDRQASAWLFVIPCAALSDVELLYNVGCKRLDKNPVGVAK